MFCKKHLKNKNGFTFIELIIVCVIFIILAGVSIPNYTASIDESKVVKAKSEIAILEIAIQQYKNDNPTVVLTTISNLETSALVNTLIERGYLQRRPSSPWKNKPIKLDKDANGNYHVFLEYDDKHIYSVY